MAVQAGMDFSDDSDLNVDMLVISAGKFKWARRFTLRA